VSPLEARLWDTHTRQRLGQPFCHATQDPTGKITFRQVLTGALSPDGKYALTGGLDNTARLWDAQAGKQLAVLRHAAPVEAVAFSPKGGRAVTGSWDQTARLWDTANGEPIGFAMNHRGPVKAVAFSPDGRQVATGSLVGERDEETGEGRPLGGEARVWEATTEKQGKPGKPVTAPLPHPHAVWKVALNRDGLLLTGAEDGCARVFDVVSGALIGQPLLHEGTVRSLVLSADGRTLLTAPAGAGQAQRARLWGLPTGLRTGASLPCAGQNAWAIRFKPDGKTLATAGADGVVRLWDREKRQCLGEPLAHRGKWVVGLALGGDNKLVAAWADEDGHKASLWDQAAGKAVHTWYHDKEIYAVAFSPDDRTVLTGTAQGTVRFWDVGTGKAVGQPLAHSGDVHAATFTPDGRIVVTVAADGLVRRWDWTTGKLLGAVQTSARPAPAGVTSDARVVMTAPRGPHAQLWSVADGMPQGSPISHRVVPVNVFSFSADSSMVLTGAGDGTARLWDVTTGQPLGPPLTHAGGVVGMAFTPDGRMVATSEKDAPVRFWTVPDPVRGNAEDVRLRVELLTAMAYDAHGVPRELGPAALAQRRQRLEKLGGLPEPD
jgi:WD40 repeat protein